MKKFFAILMTLALMLSLTIPAMAVMEGTLSGGTININDAVDGQTYSAYQILYLESYNPDAEAYAYKANSTWETWLRTQTDYISFDAQNYVTWVGGDSAESIAAFASAAQTQLVDKAPDQTAVAANGKATLSNLNLGYYLVDTTLGALCSLDTTNPTVEMDEKNEVPTITKKVEEDSKTGDEAWGDTNDADINQVVNFKATITVQAGAENYVMHDKMSAGLTYKNVTSVKIDGVPVDTDKYNVTTTCDEAECAYKSDCTFQVQFKDEFIATLKPNTQIVVEYSAILNEDAVVGTDGNPNEVVLEYGDATDPTFTVPSQTITYTWATEVEKYTKVNGEDVKLADATFKLSTDDAGTIVLKFHSLGENKYEHCADTACTKVEHKTDITTDTTGAFIIEGLDSGTYYLTETAAPAGYNKLAGPVKVVITAGTESAKTGVVTYYNYDANDKNYQENGSTGTIKVLNQSGTELPETGGMGTTIFYIVGGIMAVGAIVLLITKKRMSAEG